MMNRAHKGAKGEEAALRYLLEKGYLLLARNWRFMRKEIDLIMKQADTVVFVEVKARSTNRYGLPREAVDERKKRHLIDAAAGYMQHHGADQAARFDVVEVDLQSGEVVHLENAFMDNW